MNYQYEKEDRFFIANANDPKLKPIRIWLPKAPDYKLIDGYGLPPEEQIFKRTTVPSGLNAIFKKCKNALDVLADKNKNKSVSTQKIIIDCWNEISENQHKYKEEIAWIKNQWWHLTHGYWCFIKGKPYYFTPAYYFYLNFWPLDNGLPDFRIVDLQQSSYFKWYIRNYTINGASAKMLWEYDEQFMIERMFYGTSHPKCRRAGETFQEADDDYLTAILNKNATVSIQSFDEDAGRKQYEKKIVPAWKGLIWCFKAVWDGNENPKKGLIHNYPANIVSDNGIGSYLTYATSSKKTALDGDKNIKIHVEEPGKWTTNLIDSWGTIQNCLGQGLGRVKFGYASFSSTVYDLDEGGKYYEVLCNDSITEEDENGILKPTKSNLVVFFIKSKDRLEGYFDKWGFCDSEKAQEYIEGRKKACLDKKTAEGDAEYIDMCRQYPDIYTDSFRFNVADSGFDKKKIDDAYYRLKNGARLDNMRRGNYYMAIDGRLFSSGDYIREGLHHQKIISDIVWETDSESGRWYNSKLLQPSEANRKQNVGGVMMPADITFATMGADAFEFQVGARAGERATNKKLSDGGAALFWNRDLNLDPITKDIYTWESHRFIGTYRNAIDNIDEYCADIMFACLFNNALLFAERNKPGAVKFFYDIGLQGYLKHQWDKKANGGLGGWDVNPGYFINTKEGKDDLAKYMQTYIKYHFHREQHIDLVAEVKDIGGMENMPKFDLFASAVGALWGASIDFGSFKRQEKRKKDREKISIVGMVEYGRR